MSEEPEDRLGMSEEQWAWFREFTLGWKASKEWT
jgi:hypothetical protein